MTTTTADETTDAPDHDRDAGADADAPVDSAAADQAAPAAEASFLVSASPAPPQPPAPTPSVSFALATPIQPVPPTTAPAAVDSGKLVDATAPDGVVVNGVHQTAKTAKASAAAPRHKKNKDGGGVSQEDTKKVDITEHTLPIDEVVAKYSTSINAAHPAESVGLSADEAARRLVEHGPNMLTPPKKRHPFLRFLDILLGLFNLMLLVSGAAAYVVLAIKYDGNEQNTYLGAILIFVAFMNAAIEFYQVQKSQALLESFLNLIPSQCYVVRDGGKQQLISARDLVVGDVVLIRMGDKIPADIMLFASTDLKVDNSSLTGEAEALERGKHNSHENPLEATNLVFNGTLCVNGDGYGIVVRTGDQTVIGQIAKLTTSEQRRDSPMAIEIEHFVYSVAGLAGLTAIIFFIISMVSKGNSFSTSLNFAIGTFVAFVPEGLPATVTMLLTIAAKRMASRQVLVKDLQGVETLGAITLLATDKTGTLTRNQMTVTYVWTGLKRYIAQTTVSAVEAASSQAEPLDVKAKGVEELLHIASLCSRAKFASTDVPIAEREVIADATESGLYRWAAARLAAISTTEEFDTIRSRHPTVLEIPFNSENKWAMTIHRKPHATGDLMLYIKGAPERILRLCNTFFDGETAVPLTPEHAAAFDETYTFMASKGHRVLAFAALALPRDTYPADFEFTKDPANYPRHDLTFYGLVSLEDPPKHGVREAIGRCRAAGIKVMMVTGDHPLTAEAIGRKINLMLQDTRESLARKRGCAVSAVPESDAHAVVIHGERIDSLTDAEWDNIFSKDEIIFARTSPKHKLLIVKHAQALGHIVGVTGDGVNDSPALKKADLGIAMNQSGSDVSKEAAAMILLDDNFASTVSGIEEGRLIFQNLKKSIQYTISHTMPEVWSNLLYIAVPVPLPLSAVQILVVDLGFELLLALSYAWDPSENKEGLMKLPPRKPVNEESIARLKTRRALDAAERNKTKDEEEGEKEEDGKVAKMVRGVKRIFTQRFWREKFERTDEETLVDGDVLSYSYLEVGSIETLGCFAAFFFAMWWHFGVTPYDLQTNGNGWGVPGGANVTLVNGDVLNVDRQSEILTYGQSAFYLAIMLQQCFNLFVCKARLTYPFGAFMFRNKYTFMGLGFGALLSFMIVYIPPLNVAFSTNYRLSPLVWLVAIGGGVCVLLYGIARTFVKRALSPIKFNQDIEGLQMFPTRWSTGR